MTKQEKDRVVEELRAERERIIARKAARKLEDIAEQSVSHPLRWPGRETWPQYFERTNGGTDDNPPHKQ